MRSLDSCIGRSHALDLVYVEGRTVARRFKVHAAVIEGGRLVSAELSEAPIEEITLPLTREAATVWVLQHFEDLEQVAMQALISQLTRPTGLLA